MFKIPYSNPAIEHAPLSYESKAFRLSVHEAIGHVYIHFQTHSNIVNTRFLPLTLSVLQKRFPQVLLTECFNEENLPFSSEVVETEIGHLFEHILIQYIQELSPEGTDANDETLISGRTDWNWERDIYGTFHIIVTPAHTYSPIFKDALSKSIVLLEQIMSEQSLVTQQVL